MDMSASTRTRSLASNVHVWASIHCGPVPGARRTTDVGSPIYKMIRGKGRWGISKLSLFFLSEAARRTDREEEKRGGRRNSYLRTSGASHRYSRGAADRTSESHRAPTPIPRLVPQCCRRRKVRPRQAEAKEASARVLDCSLQRLHTGTHCQSAKDKRKNSQ